MCYDFSSSGLADPLREKIDPSFHLSRATEVSSEFDSDSDGDDDEEDSR